MRFCGALQQRHRMVEVSIRREKNRTKTLRGREHRLVVVAKLADLCKRHCFMSTRDDDFGARAGEILVKQELHNATACSVYGTSSNCASAPAKANTAEMSLAVRLG